VVDEYSLASRPIKVRNFIGQIEFSLFLCLGAARPDMDDLVSALFAIAFAAVMLVVGGLYLDESPRQLPTMPAQQMASAP
jgi:hypothetical protein